MWLALSALSLPIHQDMHVKGSSFRNTIPSADEPYSVADVILHIESTAQATVGHSSNSLTRYTMKLLFLHITVAGSLAGLDVNYY